MPHAERRRLVDLDHLVTVMQGVAGSCRVRLAGDSEWKPYGAGESFDVPGNSSFDIEVSGEPYHYICHYA